MSSNEDIFLEVKVIYTIDKGVFRWWLTSMSVDCFHWWFHGGIGFHFYFNTSTVNLKLTFVFLLQAL